MFERLVFALERRLASPSWPSWVIVGARAVLEHRVRSVAVFGRKEAGFVVCAGPSRPSEIALVWLRWL